MLGETKKETMVAVGNGQLFHTFINDLCGLMVGMVETTAARFSYPDGSWRLLSQCLGFCLYFINYKQIIAFSFSASHKVVQCTSSIMAV